MRPQKMLFVLLFRIMTLLVRLSGFSFKWIDKMSTHWCDGAGFSASESSI